MREAALLAIEFLGLLDAAEFPAGGVACLFRIHTASNVLIRERIEMCSNFEVQILFALPIVEETLDSNSRDS
ncbi:MAG TPA: hypothetical protein VMI32_18585 [Candidatus Solibacter sp.]|nr:hypothetical protein [Candidatus Solibacter sp.]